jgi:FMN phosphatase YigB (HAD superfamily)
VETNPKPYRALLLDLDGTLIDLDIELFVPAYIRLLAPVFSKFCEPEAFAVHLICSTRAMVEKSEPGLTNEAVFFTDFCRRLGQPYEKVFPLFEQFYELEFPLLRSWSRPRSHAQELVQTARRRGLKLVLATNPLFPLAAVANRLEWGGLSPDTFDLVTTVENSHFCKPRPEYYLEIAEKIGCSPSECLMAGNDVQEDLCAAEVGMDTFLVEGMILDREGGERQYTYRGSLEDLAKLISER